MRLSVLSIFLVSFMNAVGRTEMAPTSEMATYKDLSFFNNLVHFVDAAPVASTQGILSKLRKKKPDQDSDHESDTEDHTQNSHEEEILEEEEEKPPKTLVEQNGVKVEVGKQKKVSLDTEFALSLKWRPFRTAKSIKHMLLFVPKKIESTAFQKWAHLREKVQREAEAEAENLNEGTENGEEQKITQESTKKDFDDWSDSDFEPNTWEEDFLDLDQDMEFCEQIKIKVSEADGKNLTGITVSASAKDGADNNEEDEAIKKSANGENEDYEDGNYDDGNLLLQHCIPQDPRLDYPFFVRLSSHEPGTPGSDASAPDRNHEIQRAWAQPGYVLVDSSILVNMICPHMLDEFRSSPQQWGKKRSVFIRLFNASVPTPGQMRTAHQMYFPGDHVASSGSLITHSAVALVLGLISWRILL